MVFGIVVAIVNLALVLAGAAAVHRSRRLYVDVRNVVRYRESLSARDCVDRLAIFSSGEISELSIASARSTVVLTRTPDPWSESLEVKEYLLPVHANRLQDWADTASVWSDIVIIVGTAVLGVVAGNWSFVKLSNSVTAFGIAALVLIGVALMVKLLLVSTWHRAADKYRELSQSSVERRGLLTLRDQMTGCAIPAVHAGREPLGCGAKVFYVDRSSGRGSVVFGDRAVPLIVGCGGNCSRPLAEII